ncbi:hypothetical protein BGW38_001338 [Lunasporangiospora selenospora]|uniref:Cytochrome P450 n=1 Tax=Lunasporangiospora selenospora TaxID=979761 RepID=A0A9P6KE62_9FUNG|nr:hypothetical protein BGW38_001338 [Lunasporangiospora selenospora]
MIAKTVAPFGAVKNYLSASNMSIPKARIRKGDATHDAEYLEDPDRFLLQCEEEYGPVFNCLVQNQRMTIISTPRLAREIFMNDDFSFGDASEELVGFQTVALMITKSHKGDDNRFIHSILRDHLTPNLPHFSARIAEQIESVMDRGFGKGSVDRPELVEAPSLIMLEMVASTTANVFMGPEISKDPNVQKTFKTAIYDFGQALDGTSSDNFWLKLYSQLRYGTSISPMHKHVKALAQAAEPVILERRQQEAKAAEQGYEWAERPLDILQKLLDTNDKNQLKDLEDVCGHLLILILASVHTTTDTSASMLYYLAAFPECIEVLYQEQLEVLEQQALEREKERQHLINSGEAESMGEFVGTDLDPVLDHTLTNKSAKKLFYMDSFIREIFRYRTDRIALVHKARSDIHLSNGMTISKDAKVAINLRSIHQSIEHGEDLTEFRPWRNVGQSKPATKSTSEYLPFGLGK